MSTSGGRYKKRPSPYARKETYNLLTKWKITVSETEKDQWVESIWSLALAYTDHVQKFQDESDNDPKYRMPSARKREALLRQIANNSSDLLSAINNSKTIHPRFISRHLHFRTDGPDGGLLADLERKDLDSAPFVHALRLLAAEAEEGVRLHEEIGSTPRWTSTIFGHPTLRLIFGCIVRLKLTGETDPFEKLSDLANTIYAISGEEEDSIPGWADCLSQVKKWWNREGRERLATVLTEPPNEGPFDSYMDALNGAMQELVQMVEEGDMGTLGGIYPDPMLLRQKSKNKPPRES